MPATGVAAGLERDGFAIVRAAVGTDVIASALKHLAALPGSGALRTAPLDRFDDLPDHPELVAIAVDALGGAVVAFGCTFVVKPPRVGLPALWHQDGHPWEARGITRAVSIGVALDPTTEANGCLRVIPGSHRVPAHALRAVADRPNIFGAELDPDLVDESQAVSLALAPGDVSVHHPNLIHGSGANRSDVPRRTLVVRYRPAS